MKTAIDLIKKLRSGRVLVLGLIEAVLLVVHYFGGPKLEMTKIVPGFDTIMSALELFVIPLLATGAAHHAPQPAPKPLAGPGAGGLVMLVALVLGGCGSPIIGGLMSAADQAGRALAPVLGWCKDSGADRAMVERAVEAAKAKDYRTAVVLTDEMLRDRKSVV